MREESEQTGRSRIKPLDFRKRVQWFLAALVGFLVVVILFLLMFMQSVMAEAALDRRTEQRRIVAFIQAETNDPELSTATLEKLRRNLGVSAIRFEPGTGRVLRAGDPPDDIDPMTQKLGSRTLSVWFDHDPLKATRERFALVATIAIAATILGTLLLLMFLPRVVGPVETMLRDASGLGDRDASVTDERYLIDTFRASIARLQSQEAELRDLHEKEKARADDLERISRLLTRSITAGFVSVDSESRVVEINESAREILGITDFDLPSPIEVVFAPGEFRDVLASSLEEGEAVSRMEVENNGSTIGLTTVPLRNDDRRVVGLLALFTDLTELRELERRVGDLRLLADLGEVAAGIAHEFRNSLGTILGYIRMALRAQLGDDPERRLSAAEREGQRMAETISALLAFTRPIEPESEPIDLGDVVRDTLSRFDATIESRIDDGAMVLADRPLMESIVENLVRNALEAVDRAGGSGVSVDLVREPSLVRLDVTDDGDGIPEEIRSGLYLPFKSGRPEGTGMGLALARKIALSHGGTLTHQDRPEGGTVARLELPLAETGPAT